MKRKRIKIDAKTRAEVYARSGGICERCHERPAVHIHHLTYKRAGKELLSDLRHVCILCHCKAHPKSAKELLEWELHRGGEVPDQIEEYWEEELPALNLGNYNSSGYDIEAVELEEQSRRVMEQHSELHPGPRKVPAHLKQEKTA